MTARNHPNMLEGGNHIGMAEELDGDSDEILRLRTDDFFIHQSPYAIEVRRSCRMRQV